jgi:hypothetical protein
VPRFLLRRALAAGAFARALYPDALGLQFRRAARYPHLQYAVLETGAYPILLDVVGQNEAPAEGAVTALPDVVARARLLLLCFALAAYGKHPLVERYLHVFALDAGQLGIDEQVPALVNDVERRRPLRLGGVLLAAGVPKPPNISSKRRFTSLCGS